MLQTAMTSMSKMSSPYHRKFLVAGGNGFIGSHIAKALLERGHFVRIADIAPSSSFTENICTELLVGNLCDPSFCERATRGIHTVLHFAATMGGMGTIRDENDFVIYPENAMMTINILSAAVRAGARRFFYASSACVYPVSLQGHGQADVSLREGVVWADVPPEPQGLYGLEKLVSELLLRHCATRIEGRVARFHNVFGPRGAWANGREKAPAALIRKAIATALDAESPPTLEIWGDGMQRRSFLYIDDCVDGVLQLLDSDCSEPVNIGSDRSVTINELADIAIRCAGMQRGDVALQYLANSRPVGVGARNSDNTFVKETLGWMPRVSLENGMARTAEWIKAEMETMIDGFDNVARGTLLRTFQQSQLVDLERGDILFAILLPITSRGLDSPEECLRLLQSFAQSLARTTWRDTHELGGVRFRLKVYLAIDNDDAFLLRTSENGQELNVAEAMLLSAGISDVTTEICSVPRGHVCTIWRQIARRAWTEGCDFFTLMGDDVVLQDEGWMRDIQAEFSAIADDGRVPPGFGCVAFMDTTFPGMPTFPVLNRVHMDIFSGEVVPDVFINQDGDPFLFQLYRRWGCSRMIKSRISNDVGGSYAARYAKQSADGWTFGPLDRATSTVERWLVSKVSYPIVARKLTVDIIIPCYRVQIPFLDTMLALEPSRTCAVMFIIIIDNPSSPHIVELETKYAHRPDVRIRVNTENLGASASRNRGMKESAAEWVIFLDDDVIPRLNILLEAEKVIRAHPQAAGFIGNSQFPIAESIFTSAAHLAGVTYFWDIAEKMDLDDMPWGVTANLITRRAQDGVEYDLQFPKTGGGEDIDFCRKKRDFSIAHGGHGFYAAPEVVVTHPWWNGGQRSYRRFYMWSKGDGGLVRLYPSLTYLDHAPNSAELLLMNAAVAVLGAVCFVGSGDVGLFIVAIDIALAILVANVTHDMYRHLWRDAERTKAIKSTLTGIAWVLAVVESAFIRMASEGGRVVGLLERKEFMLLGRRFDWFTGSAGDGPRNEERMNARQRMTIAVAFLAVLRSARGN